MSTSVRPSMSPHADYYPELLRLARATLAHYLSAGGLLPYETDNDWYLTPAAVFVTLRVREARDAAGVYGESWAAGDLRGCIVDQAGRTVFLDMEVFEAPHIRDWFRDFCCTPCPSHITPYVRGEAKECVRILATILFARRLH